MKDIYGSLIGPGDIIKIRTPLDPLVDEFEVITKSKSSVDVLMIRLSVPPYSRIIKQAEVTDLGLTLTPYSYLHHRQLLSLLPDDFFYVDKEPLLTTSPDYKYQSLMTSWLYSVFKGSITGYLKDFPRFDPLLQVRNLLHYFTTLPLFLSKLEEYKRRIEQGYSDPVKMYY